MGWAALLPVRLCRLVVSSPMGFPERISQDADSFADAKVMGLWSEVEAGLYQGLSVEGNR